MDRHVAIRTDITKIAFVAVCAFALAAVKGLFLGLVGTLRVRVG